VNLESLLINAEGWSTSSSICMMRMMNGIQRKRLLSLRICPSSVDCDAVRRERLMDDGGNDPYHRCNHGYHANPETTDTKPAIFNDHP
jgi:hypothetical protein